MFLKSIFELISSALTDFVGVATISSTINIFRLLDYPVELKLNYAAIPIGSSTYRTLPESRSLLELAIKCDLPKKSSNVYLRRVHSGNEAWHNL